MDLRPPDPDMVAQAIARTNGWVIVPDENTAMILLHISTHIPARWTYITDGPNKKYVFDSVTLEFRKAPLRETARLSRNAAILVHGIKGLGADHITDDAVKKISSFIPRDSWQKIIVECKGVNGWVLETIKQVAEYAKNNEVHE